MFAIILRKKGRLWNLTALYADKRGQTVVSSSWHACREHAVHDAQYLLI